MDLLNRRYFGYRSFEPEYETMKVMRGLGIQVVTIMVSNNTNFMGSPYTRHQPTWIWDHEYDFALFDQNVNEVIESVPDVRLNVVIDLNPPSWWIKRFGGQRYDPFYEFGRIAADKSYREEVADYLKALLTHAVSTYPGRFLNFCIMGGKTTEWFDDSQGTESTQRRDAWHEWCKAHGLAECDVPGYSVRYSGVPESGGLLRTPATHQLALDYWRFNSELSRETVSVFLRQAREVLPPEIGIGITYGYIFELTWCFSKASWCQMEYEKLFDEPFVDFALSPISYGLAKRGMGGSPMAMIPLQTLRCRGKWVSQSIDTTTFTSRFPKTPGKSGTMSICGRRVEWATPDEEQAGMKREMCYTLINGCGVWYFDMWGGWYDNDMARQTLRECRRVWGEQCAYPVGDASDVLMVVDPENMMYINDAHEDCDTMVTPVRNALAKAGAMYTTASFGDLFKMDLSHYKLLIMCHPFDLDHGKLEKLREVAAGKTIMWIYGAGIIHDGAWDPDHAQSVMGCPFGGKDIRMGDHMVYVPRPREITEQDMRAAYAAAGVHVWCEKPLPVYANDRLVSLHVAGADEVTLKLPRQYATVTELFTGKTYTAVSSLTLKTERPETFLFELKD